MGTPRQGVRRHSVFGLLGDVGTGYAIHQSRFALLGTWPNSR